MNNKVQKLAVLTAMVAITAVILFNNAVQPASAIYEDEVPTIIPYSDNNSHQKSITFEIDGATVIYENNNKDGFTLAAFIP